MKKTISCMPSSTDVTTFKFLMLTYIDNDLSYDQIKSLLKKGVDGSFYFNNVIETLDDKLLDIYIDTRVDTSKIDHQLLYDTIIYCIQNNCFCYDGSTDTSTFLEKLLSLNIAKEPESHFGNAISKYIKRLDTCDTDYTILLTLIEKGFEYPDTLDLFDCHTETRELEKLYHFLQDHNQQLRCEQINNIIAALALCILYNDPSENTTYSYA